MKNLLIGSRGDPKSISRKKGSPKCEAPYFHKKSEFRKKEKMTDLIKSYEQQFGNLTAEVMSNNDYDSSMTHGYDSRRTNLGDCKNKRVWEK